MQSVNPVLPDAGFAEESLLAPVQAIVAYFSRVSIAPPEAETVSLGDALGRVLAQRVVADEDLPIAARSVMDGFALDENATPGTFEIAGEVRMGAAPAFTVAPGCAARIPTGGILPDGTNAVVPIEDARVEGSRIEVERIESGTNVAERGADLRAGELLLEPGRRIRSGEIALLATTGVTDVSVYRRPVVAVLSSGDELIPPHERPLPGQIRDSNRYAVAASLEAMGAQPRHYPTLCDEPDEFEAGLAQALAECDALAVTGGSSVGERDRLPEAVAAIADPSILVHGLRVKPGKPTLLGAAGGKPILGLPGNPVSALVILEAVARPIVAALCGAPIPQSSLQAKLAGPARSRPGWTWYVPVRLEDERGATVAHPLPVRSFSVSLLARADGYIVMDEDAVEWPAGTPVTVYRFLGG